MRTVTLRVMVERRALSVDSLLPNHRQHRVSECDGGWTNMTTISVKHCRVDDRDKRRVCTEAGKRASGASGASGACRASRAGRRAGQVGQVGCAGQEEHA